MSLTGKTKANSYKDLLQMNNSNNGIDGSNRNVVDGEGTLSALSMSDNRLIAQPKSSDTTGALIVFDMDGNTLFAVDSANDLVKAGIGQNVVNTQYAYFNVGNTESTNFLDDTHMALLYQSANYGASGAGYIPAFGTSTDPATTFTTSEGNGTRSAELIPVMWRVPDNITLDDIKHFEGADTATGDTTRMHLMSYTFNTGATGALTSGAVVANTSADNTNAGSEQPYLKDWTIGTADIDAGKVLLCMFKSDSVNSDYSVSVTVKYHLTG